LGYHVLPGTALAASAVDEATLNEVLKDSRDSIVIYGISIRGIERVQLTCLIPLNLFDSVLRNAGFPSISGGGMFKKSSCIFLFLPV